jgi:D-alanyl-D-alanine carboxypeptidase
MYTILIIRGIAMLSFHGFNNLRLNAIRSLLIILLFLVVAGRDKSTAELNLYGGMPPERYLSGQFNPAKEPLFVSLSAVGIPTDGKEHYLRREVATALKRLYEELCRDHPGVEFWIRSSTRSWYAQKILWENKWNGRTLVGGIDLSMLFKDSRKRALKILEYSSMPGTSRHHWGTDFDMNVLRNSYYDSGNGAIVYQWMRKNARRFGFCQPYTAGRREGYKEERWHWSYMPLARLYLRDWKRIFKNKERRMRMGSFDGCEDVLELAPIFVENINSECQ